MTGLSLVSSKGVAIANISSAQLPGTGDVPHLKWDLLFHCKLKVMCLFLASPRTQFSTDSIRRHMRELLWISMYTINEAKNALPFFNICNKTGLLSGQLLDNSGRSKKEWFVDFYKSRGIHLLSTKRSIL